MHTTFTGRISEILYVFVMEQLVSALIAAYIVYFRKKVLLQLLPQEFGTYCCQNYEMPTCHTPVQAVAEDIFIWTARLRRIVTL